jgi:BirA family biotin operon repressor/biotin-[acetyl-CoA-carboxylase] ligase
LTKPKTALDPEKIRSLMSPGPLQMLGQITALEETDSTNSFLKRLPLEQQHGHAVFAESQTGGRGRRQRSWFSPPGCNIYLSLGWFFDKSCGPLSTLPLAVAVATCRALSRAGIEGHGIKWPNDILAGGAKLAGILVESQAPGAEAVYAVIGVGLNVFMPAEGADAVIDRPWTDIETLLPGREKNWSRNGIAADLLQELVHGAGEFEASGFNAFEPEWCELDLLAGKEVLLQQNGAAVSGIARGIDADGGLVLDTVAAGGKMIRQVFHAGEVSVYRG